MCVWVPNANRPLHGIPGLFLKGVEYGGPRSVWVMDDSFQRDVLTGIEDPRDTKARIRVARMHMSIMHSVFFDRRDA